MLRFFFVKLEKIFKMNTIEKLRLIEDTWRHYIWEYNFLKEELNFNDELNTNYVGVIFGYFHDTLPIVTNYIDNKASLSLGNKFLTSIGLLQVIYLQQDLISELNKSFGITHKIEFGDNRNLRNELIGHPISRNKRDKNSLESFCLFGYNSSELGDINYLKYHKNNDFKCEIKGYFTSQVVNEHVEFLNKNFDIIINKIKSLLTQFKKKLNNLNSNIENLEFKKLLEEVNLYSNYFIGSNNTFNSLDISKLYVLKKSHPRYIYNFELFLKNIKCDIIENINNINKKYLNKKDPIIDSKYVGLSSNYTFGKLYSNHPIFGISYFKNRFSEDKNIIEELKNMENNIGENLEYYSSYNYLQYLLNRDYIDFFND